MWIDVLILSIVEGVTEFLPVSSTGHMIIAKSLLGMEDSDALNAFLIIVQGGAILAVVSLFWKLFLKWAVAWLQFFSPATGGEKFGSALVPAAEGVSFRLQSVLVSVSVIPFALLGYIGKDFIKSLFNYRVVSWGLIAGGIFILASEFLLRRRSAERSVETFGVKDALLVGCGQCLALWPGFSRSAATLLFGRVMGFSRSASAELSFLIGLPTLLGVASYEALKEWRHLSAEWLGYLAVGVVVSWIVAYVCVKGFVAFLKRFDLTVFAWYRIVFGAFILWYLEGR